MKVTDNFHLNLPDLDDMADVEKLNENFQTIDTTMKSLETDPELAANVVDIKNKIGEESDADTQPTLFGRLAQLKNVLEKLAGVLTKVTGIDTKIGTSGDTAGTATLFGQVKDISEKMPTGIIKSVQRGVISTKLNLQTVDIAISPVNPDKSLLIFTTGTLSASTGYSNDDCAVGDGIVINSFTEDNINITYRGFGTDKPEVKKISWQVSEFF